VVTRGEPGGEFIARIAIGSNDWDWHGAKTLEGLFGPDAWLALA
jgi:hypothetical protein